jgi:hypothetical protein
MGCNQPQWPANLLEQQPVGVAVLLQARRRAKAGGAGAQNQDRHLPFKRGQSSRWKRRRSDGWP